MIPVGPGLIRHRRAARHGGAYGFGPLAVALANVQDALDRCKAVAERIEAGEPPRYDLGLAEAMEQVPLKSRRVIDAGAFTQTVCRPVCRPRF